MKSIVQRLVGGAVAGAIASIALVETQAVPVVGPVVGLLAGAAFAAGLGPGRRSPAEMALAGSALGIPLWALITCIGVPLFAGRGMVLSGASMRDQFPSLIGWMLYGGLLGALAPWLVTAVERFGGTTAKAAGGATAAPRRIVILGGGFAGMTTAAGLERELWNDPSVLITLVSAQNSLLFTPMLAEVAGGSLEASHISTPLRTTLPRTEFVRGRAVAVNFAGRTVTIAPLDEGTGTPRELAYEHLVFAVGAVSNYFGGENLQKFAFDFKTLLDAIRIRNHIIEMFERADREPRSQARRTLLTFVVAGGGFAGVELAGAVNDFTRGICADYAGVQPDEIKTILVHSRDRILPELSESLGRYALDSLRARGVEFRLGSRVVDAQADSVTLSDGELRTRTLVWTAGTAPNPWLKSIGLRTDKRGAAEVESTMAVAGLPGVWALGDCAALKDGKSGHPCPPTAQFAMREGRTLARNLCRALQGKPPQAFHFDSLGSLCVIGYQTACAELTIPFARHKSVRFSGLLAWMMWRGIYIAKLPGAERKARVLLDWTFEIFFPRDIVQTIDLK